MNHLKISLHTHFSLCDAVHVFVHKITPKIGRCKNSKCKQLEDATLYHLDRVYNKKSFQIFSREREREWENLRERPKRIIALKLFSRQKESEMRYRAQCTLYHLDICCSHQKEALFIYTTNIVIWCDILVWLWNLFALRFHVFDDDQTK